MNPSNKKSSRILSGLANKLAEKKVAKTSFKQFAPLDPPSITPEAQGSSEVTKKSDMEDRKVAIKVINKTKMMESQQGL